jgi:hypothetical protein
VREVRDGGVVVVVVVVNERQCTIKSVSKSQHVPWNRTQQRCDQRNNPVDGHGVRPALPHTPHTNTHKYKPSQKVSCGHFEADATHCGACARARAHTHARTHDRRFSLSRCLFFCMIRAESAHRRPVQRKFTQRARDARHHATRAHTHTFANVLHTLTTDKPRVIPRGHVVVATEVLNGQHVAHIAVAEDETRALTRCGQSHCIYPRVSESWRWVDTSSQNARHCFTPVFLTHRCVSS